MVTVPIEKEAITHTIKCGKLAGHHVTKNG